MLNIKCQEHYNAVIDYAKSINMLDQFHEKLKQLKNLGDTIELYKDFAAHSFYFVCFENGKRTLEGGLIFHSPEADKSNFAVTLNPTSGWKIHT